MKSLHNGTFKNQTTCDFELILHYIITLLLLYNNTRGIHLKRIDAERILYFEIFNLSLT